MPNSKEWAEFHLLKEKLKQPLPRPVREEVTAAADGAPLPPLLPPGAPKWIVAALQGCRRAPKKELAIPLPPSKIGPPERYISEEVHNQMERERVFRPRDKARRAQTTLRFDGEPPRKPRGAAR
jgi:hypothetical protein